MADCTKTRRRHHDDDDAEKEEGLFLRFCMVMYYLIAKHEAKDVFGSELDFVFRTSGASGGFGHVRQFEPMKTGARVPPPTKLADFDFKVGRAVSSGTEDAF